MHDVYAYGVIAPSTLVELRDSFPPAGGYGEIAAVHQSIGGEAAAGAYVLARLGVKTKLAGTRLGTDDATVRAFDVLSAAGVDCSALTPDPEVTPVTEIVFSAGDTRTVFGTYGALLADRAWHPPSLEDVQASRIVCLDPFFGDESIQVARWCVEYGIPYVTVDTRPESEIAHHATVLILSADYTTAQFDEDPAEVLAAYTDTCDGLVILTRGGGSILCGRAGEELREYPAFQVEARDTTGAGDSFRAGLIHAMLRGDDEATMIATASAVAALVCLGVPGVLESPTPAELTEFLTAE